MAEGPLAGRYPAAAAMVVLFLVPYLGLSSALRPLAPLIAAQLHMSVQALSLTSGMANAGYAVGAVLAVQFAQLLPQRRMLLAVLLVYQYRQAAAHAAQPGQHHPGGGRCGCDLRGGRVDVRAGADRGSTHPHYAPLHPAWAATWSAAWPALSRPTRRGPC